jgi:hypothetical protein
VVRHSTDTQQWKGRDDMVMIMDKLGVSELLEHLVEQEVGLRAERQTAALYVCVCV